MVKPRWEDTEGARSWSEHSRFGAYLREYQRKVAAKAAKKEPK